MPLKSFITVLLGLALIGCGQDVKEKLVPDDGADTTASASESEAQDSDDTITIGEVVNGRSQIIIPLGLFGDSVDDLEDAAVDVELNGEGLHNDIPAASYYDDDLVAVIFYLSGLEDGDRLGFTLIDAAGNETAYSGVASQDGDSETEPGS